MENGWAGSMCMHTMEFASAIERIVIRPYKKVDDFQEVWRMKDARLKSSDTENAI